MPTLGPGIDGFIKEASLASLGPGIDGAIKTIPSASLGPGIDGAILNIPWPLYRSAQIAFQTINEDRLSRTTFHAINSVTDIDLTSATTTTIFTAPSDKTALILGVILEVTAADTITVPPQVSIGLNPSTTDVFAIETLITLDAVNDSYVYWANIHKAVSVANSGVLDLDVGVAATATTLVVTARVIGLLV